MHLIEFLAHLATLTAACVAVYGVHAWRTEHRGTKQIDLAEETLALFYQADDAIKYIRNPGSYSSETDDVKQGDSESEREFLARKNASIVFKRFQDHNETFSKIHALRYRFLATFGKDATRPFDELNEINWEIKRSAMRLARLWSRNYLHDPEQIASHRAEIDKYEAVFWTGFDDDPLEPRIAACIKNIEATCRGIIEYGAEYRAAAGRDA
jgi:hypothetical protein